MRARSGRYCTRPGCFAYIFLRELIFYKQHRRTPRRLGARKAKLCCRSGHRPVWPDSGVFPIQIASCTLPIVYADSRGIFDRLAPLNLPRFGRPARMPFVTKLLCQRNFRCVNRCDLRPYWRVDAIAASMAVPNRSAISGIWRSSRIKGGASRTWSPRLPSIVPPLG